MLRAEEPQGDPLLRPQNILKLYRERQYKPGFVDLVEKSKELFTLQSIRPSNHNRDEDIANRAELLLDKHW